MYRFGGGSLLLIFHSPFAGRTQLTGEREKCYLVGLEASGWGMGGKKGTKGSYPEARPANGERPTDAPFPAVPRGHPTLVVVETPNACCCLRTYCSAWAGCSTLVCCARVRDRGTNLVCTARFGVTAEQCSAKPRCVGHCRIALV